MSLRVDLGGDVDSVAALCLGIVAAGPGGLRFGEAVPTGLPGKLAAANVFVSVRGKAMRVTPHLYNTDADVERLFSVMKEAL